jgi:hypothetical protein
VFLCANCLSCQRLVETDIDPQIPRGESLTRGLSTECKWGPMICIFHHRCALPTRILSPSIFARGRRTLSVSQIDVVYRSPEVRRSEQHWSLMAASQASFYLPIPRFEDLRHELTNAQFKPSTILSSKRPHPRTLNSLYEYVFFFLANLFIHNTNPTFCCGYRGSPKIWRTSTPTAEDCTFYGGFASGVPAMSIL